MAKNVYDHDLICTCRCHVKEDPNIMGGPDIGGCPGFDRVYAGDPNDRLCCGLHDEKYINIDGTIDSTLYSTYKIKIQREYRKKNSIEWYGKSHEMDKR